jgi:hypothetical protein
MADEYLAERSYEPLQHWVGASPGHGYHRMRVNVDELQEISPRMREISKGKTSCADKEATKSYLVTSIATDAIGQMTEAEAVRAHLAFDLRTHLLFCG